MMGFGRYTIVQPSRPDYRFDLTLVLPFQPHTVLYSSELIAETHLWGVFVAKGNSEMNCFDNFQPFHLGLSCPSIGTSDGSHPDQIGS